MEGCLIKYNTLKNHVIVLVQHPYPIHLICGEITICVVSAINIYILYK